MLLFRCSVVSSCLWPRGLRHAGLPCPSPSSGACSKSCASSQWCRPTISSSVFPFSSCLQSFPASGSFLMSRLFPSGGQSIGASASASVLPVNTQGWSPLGWTGWISLQSKGDSCFNSWFCFSWLIMPYPHWVCLRDVGVRQRSLPFFLIRAGWKSVPWGWQVCFSTDCAELSQAAPGRTRNADPSVGAGVGEKACFLPAGRGMAENAACPTASIQITPKQGDSKCPGVLL